jgi:tetratricopeptide (TPR) repeat protein
VLPLLPGGPHCGVIITSRCRMTGLPGAHGVTVDVLDDEQSIHLLARVIGEERVRTERAAGRSLVDLCARLPLALRIAGARLASRPHWRVDDLVRRLSDESRRLDEFVHKGLELRSNIGLTYAALDPRAQALFRLCAAIRAPDLPSWVAAALLDTTLLEGEDLLERLVDAQLLKVVTLPNEPVRRYRFHDLVRVYALEQLTHNETQDQLRDALVRVLGGWLHLSDEAHRWQYGGDDTVLHGTAPRWTPPDAPLPERITDSMQWWERERRGLVPAIRQAAAAGLHEACWDLALTSITLFETKGYHDDWRETATVAHEAATTAGNERGRAAAQYSLGTLALSQKRLDLAEQHFGAALALFVRVNDRHGRALVLRNAAFISRVRGEATVLDRYDEALTAMRDVGDRIGEAHVLASLAKLHIELRDYSMARGMLDEAARICRESGCLRVEAQVVYRLGELHLATGQLDLAREALHRTLRVVRDLGDRTGEAYALHSIGVVRIREGRFDIAENTLAHSLRLARTVGDRWIEAQTLFEMAQNAIAQEEYRLADDLLAEALALFATLDSPQWQARSLLLRAELGRLTGALTVARAMSDQAEALLECIEGAESSDWSEQLQRLRASLEEAV